MDWVVEAEGLGKRYGRQWALSDCTLRIPAGRVVALVGPNGAGKSTFLHLAVGLLEPDAGQVSVFGQAPYDNVAVLPDIGFVAQDTPLYADFTAADLVAMGGHLNPRWDAAFARERLAQRGIPPKKAVGKLSGGQRAQVALALALAKRPRLLLLDEPVASLDPLARREFLQALMGSVADSGTTVVLSSHLLTDLERVCDHVVVLQSARVRLAGEVDTLLATHRQVVGPRQLPGVDERIPGVAEVIRASHTDRQSTLIARTEAPVGGAGWTEHEIGLEDLILAYLAEDHPSTETASHDQWGVLA